MGNTNIMNFKKTAFTSLLLLGCCGALCADDGGDSLTVFEGEIALETNYGYNYYKENRTVLDFPHIVACGDLQLGKGWLLSAEFEYERFYEDGEWCGSFKDHFSTNRLYVNKEFDAGFNLKCGIVEVPVGLTNAGGPALTIYDPENEAGVLPMSWHETGIAAWGMVGKWRYEISAVSYLDFPLNSSCALGVAFRSDFMDIADGLRAGASGYWGKSHSGMVRRCRADDFIGTNGLFFGAVDFDYQNRGFIAGGSMVYCTDHGAKSVGVEFGYDFSVLAGLSEKGVQLLPFVRYDGVFEVDSRNKLTVGMNISPLCNLVLKIEYGYRHYCRSHTERTLDMGVGYSIYI